MSLQQAFDRQPRPLHAGVIPTMIDGGGGGIIDPVGDKGMVQFKRVEVAPTEGGGYVHAKTVPTVENKEDLIQLKRAEVAPAGRMPAPAHGIKLCFAPIIPIIIENVEKDFGYCDSPGKRLHAEGKPIERGYIDSEGSRGITDEGTRTAMRFSSAASGGWHDAPPTLQAKRYAGDAPALKYC